MRRAPVVLTTTVAGTAAVLGFHAHQPDRPSVAAASGGAGGTAAAGGAPPSSAGGAGASGTKTATGDAVGTPYGDAQVRVTVTNGKITDVQAVQLQGNDPKSVAISSSAEPLLRQSALARQSAAVDVVSGATFTSESYSASLQSALDKVGFQASDGSRGSAPSAVPQQGGDDGPWGRADGHGPGDDGYDGDDRHEDDDDGDEHGDDEHDGDGEGAPPPPVLGAT